MAVPTLLIWNDDLERRWKRYPSYYSHLGRVLVPYTLFPRRWKIPLWSYWQLDSPSATGALSFNVCWLERGK